MLKNPEGNESRSSTSNQESNQKSTSKPSIKQSSMQPATAGMITGAGGEVTRSIMKNSSLKTANQPSYYETTNLNLWKKQDDSNTNEQSPKSTSSSSSATNANSSNPVGGGAAATATAATSSSSQTTVQKPKVRFNLDINYEKEREWNRVNKIIVDASKSEIEWTQEVEV